MVAIQHSARHLQHTVVSAEYSDQVQGVNTRRDRKEPAKEVLHQMLLALLVGRQTQMQFLREILLTTERAAGLVLRQ